ncbi:hypothetical protein PE066_12855 [Ramlibacter tataouinensis]|uniref:hypothetical protein n=1 Tax=Ramlibacter tataouinensis TaxID=94132 RepID=UPI0022F3C10E|nr:hypothetical protein [Ramlibacter tataouinensis]WBY00362.1 hypothetical protein PE066_12855 [Ramlibacter tataouinensis]
MKARLAALLLGGASALANAADCPQPAEVTPLQMLGLWHAEFDGLAQGATLLLERHPVYAQSLRGAINRDGERRLVAGDIEEGEVTLEESADGRRIDGTWLGEVVPGSCGREIRGSWQPRGEGKALGFTMRKL